MKVITVDQRSLEWMAARCGRLTGSRVGQMLATRKDGKEAAGRINLRLALALERITGQSAERGFVTQAMQDGIDREPQAIELYQAVTGELVDAVGFVQHDSLMAGYSPDGVVGDFEGLIEVKCPEPAAHLAFLETGKIDSDYMAQMSHGMWLTGAKWCDFISYQPLFPEGKRLKVTRIQRDEKLVADHDLAVRAFLAEVDALVAKIGTLEGVA